MLRKREKHLPCMAAKQRHGQFYTVEHDYILDGFAGPPPHATKVIEPFAGKGDLLTWLATKGTTLPVEAYDIDPKAPGIQRRDTLQDPPSYKDAWILTNPPYLARNKCENKTYFDTYDTNDLYKCFLHSLTSQPDLAAGGILILPVGFFLSPRDVDARCRNAFLSKYRILHVRYFEEDVFPDTPTTVVAFKFERASSPLPLKHQTVPWTKLPDKIARPFLLRQEDNWIIGGEIYKLPQNPAVQIRRWVEGMKLKEGEVLTSLTLNALDSGKEDGRIALTFQPGYAYPAKESSRAYATLCLRGKTLTQADQEALAKRFTEVVEAHRKKTWSLFLPQFRESKEYARKRIPFELAYLIVSHLLRD